MGMFDIVRSSYKLGKEFEGVNQTKDIRCDGGSLIEHWIDPSGKLWMIDTSDTQDFVLDEDNLLYYRWEPNGRHGRVTPLYITGSVKIYPEKYYGPPQDLPTCTINFIDGIIKSFSLHPKHYYEIHWT